MVKRTLKMRQAIALILALTLAGPMTALADDGKKHFKQGLKYEENRQWDKAAEKFALAVAEKPSNIEYQLHFQRALVSAAIMLVERGDMLAEKKDYNAAYQAYRQAYAFDPTNELALIKMRRMLEAQGLPTDSLPSGSDPSGPSFKPKSADPNAKAAFTVTTSNGSAARNGNGVKVTQFPDVPMRKFPKTQVIARSDNLLSVIEQLAQDMGLNVIFDTQVATQMRNAKIAIELRDVTKPKALEMILQTNNLMYSQLDSRTIVIAMDNPQSRLRYENHSVRTFYVKNADIQEIRTAITSTLQTKQVVPVKQLNALIVRDSPTNLELIGQMIESLDKSKAEVLIDVNIYEVSRNDLLQIGNQFNATGAADTLVPGASFLGGIGQPGVLGKGPRTLTGPLGFALGLPASAISFFQSRGKAKLLASTQVHVLDTEAQSIRIGQRVPIQTATLPSFNVPTDRQQRRAADQQGVTQSDLTLGLGGSLGVGIPQIQYENVGLNIDVTPKVFEDDVEMKMKIESTSVDTSTGKLTPSFNQRTLTSVARIKDGQTTLVAGVSQTVESKSVKGLPIIGLIPILGRFFSTPETDNRQSDVVITVTPHILRRADITEQDHLAKQSGTALDPSTQLTIEHILYLADVEDAQRNHTAGLGSPGDQAKPGAAPAAESKTVPTTFPSETTERPGVVVLPQPTRQTPTVAVQPNSASGSQVIREPAKNIGGPTPARPTAAAANDEDEGEDDEEEDETPAGKKDAPVTVMVRSASAVATKDQDLYVAIIVNGNAEISSTNISLNYDPNILDVKHVRDGGMLRAGGANPELQFHAEGGLLNVQMDRPAGAPGVGARGQLMLIIFRTKAQGVSPLTLNDQTFFRSPSGQNVTLRLQSAQVEVR